MFVTDGIEVHVCLLTGVKGDVRTGHAGTVLMTS